MGTSCALAFGFACRSEETMLASIAITSCESATFIGAILWALSITTVNGATETSLATIATTTVLALVFV